VIETTAPDPRIYGVLAEAGFGAELFNPRQHRCCELVDRYALEHATMLLGALEVDALLRTALEAKRMTAVRTKKFSTR